MRVTILQCDRCGEQIFDGVAISGVVRPVVEGTMEEGVHGGDFCLSCLPESIGIVPPESRDPAKRSFTALHLPKFASRMGLAPVDVLYVLRLDSEWADADGWRALPTAGEMAAALNVSAPTVGRVKRDLVHKGYMTLRKGELGAASGEGVNLAPLEARLRELRRMSGMAFLKRAAKADL